MDEVNLDIPHRNGRSLWGRVWSPFRARRWTLSAAVALTPLEQQQAKQIEYLQAELRGRDLEIEKLKGTIEVQKLEIRQLAAVNERDHIRVQAEQAEFAARIAAATGQRSERQSNL